MKIASCVPAAVAATSAGFIGSRWRGETRLTVLYWRDILAIGSLVNLFVGFAALMLAAQGVDFWVAAVVHFAVLPYNVFLVAALWRTPRCSKTMVWTSWLWLAAFTVI
jgi:hypothetical protein